MKRGDHRIASPEVIPGAINSQDQSTRMRTHVFLCRIPADAAAGNTWDIVIAVMPHACTIQKVGICSETSFGQVANYAILTFKRKVAGDTVAAYNFTAATTAFAYIDFGAVTNPSVAAGDCIRLAKTLGGAGQIVPALIAYVEVTYDTE